MTHQGQINVGGPGVQRMPPAILHGWFYVPYAAIGSREALDGEKKRLTFVPKFAEPEDPPIRLYRDLPSRGYLGVPKAYGLSRYPWLQIDDRRTSGVEIERAPRLPDPNHPRVKDPAQQAAFMQSLLQAANQHESFVAKADTGTGKTVCALWLSQQLLRRTTILVPLERLMDQWLEEIRDKLGLPEERIGRVQGPTCQFEGKDVIVGMMHSLSMRNSYPPEFFRSVGLVVYDECHRVGSAVLSRCASLFPAQYQLALSATPDRADGGDRVVYWHVGPVRVVSKAPALECTVYVKRYRTRRELYGKHPQSRAKCLSQDPDRNRMIVDLILRNWRIGRNILVIGKFIDHLQDLMEACIRAGIPVTDMGQFTGQQNVRQTVMTHEGPRRRTVRSMKVQKTEYDRIKAESRIIFATYGVFKEGIDVPRLDCGIDVLPQSAATQVIGRIRRPMEGKPTPYWITILDEECAFSQSMFIKRVKDYRATGCRIVDNGRV